MYDIDGLRQLKFYSDVLNKRCIKNVNIINNTLKKCNDLIKKRIIVSIEKCNKKELVNNTLKNILYVNKKNNKILGGSNNKNIKITGDISKLNNFQKNILNKILINNKQTGGNSKNSKIFEKLNNNLKKIFLNNNNNNSKNLKVYIVTITIIVFLIILFISLIYYFCFI